MLYLLLATFLAILLYYKLIRRTTKYWNSRNVIQEPALPLIGNMATVIIKKHHFSELLTRIYQNHPTHRYVGFMQFTRPVLLLRDVDLIKEVTVKSFSHFQDRASILKNDNDPLLSKTLLALTGKEWHDMRSTLSPIFTTSHLKTMYFLMNECAEKILGHFQGKEQVAVEMLDLFSRFGTDVIATTAFGIQIDSFKDRKNHFFEMGKRFNPGFLQQIVLSTTPTLGKIFGTSLLPSDVTKYFKKIITDNIEKRKNQEIVRPDLLHLLMEAKKGKLQSDSSQHGHEGFSVVEEPERGNFEKVPLTDDVIAAQSILFFIAGFETVSRVSGFLAYELALHPEIQERLQEEIDGASDHGRVPYETLVSLKYLDQCLSEVLRLWPPAFQIDRVCVKDYQVDKDLTIRRNESLIIPVIAIHRDPEFYPDPERFDPERFSDENKGRILLGSYMPFGAGPRNCIGSRFALLEIKILFVNLLSKFSILPINATKIPVKIDKKKVSINPESGFKLALKPRCINFS